MALTQEEVMRHREKATDLKNFIQVLTPLVASPNTPQDIRDIASTMMKSYLSQIQIGIPENIIKPLI